MHDGLRQRGGRYLDARQPLRRSGLRVHDPL
jgi:hypothetical protein